MFFFTACTILLFTSTWHIDCATAGSAVFSRPRNAPAVPVPFDDPTFDGVLFLREVSGLSVGVELREKFFIEELFVVGVVLPDKEISPAAGVPDREFSADEEMDAVTPCRGGGEERGDGASDWFRDWIGLLATFGLTGGAEPSKATDCGDCDPDNDKSFSLVAISIESR